MAGITRRRAEEADGSIDYGERGEAIALTIGEERVWRSRLLPGWSWDEDIKPYTGGATSCPLTHREYVIAGSIRYLMEDGTEEIAEAGDYLHIGPGHRAWVAGEEPCLLLDW